MRFKGNYGDRKRMMHKSEGHGLQTYAILQNGYPHQMLCAMILCQRILDKSLTPLDAIVMARFDTVEGKQHQCAIDNLYKSFTFFKAVYNHEKKVLTRGDTRKETRGVPPRIKQE